MNTTVHDAELAVPPVVRLTDLGWWLDLAPSLEWIWARTYARTAPHDYVVAGRSPRLSRADFLRAGAVIRTFGQPGRFYRSTNIYLTSPDGRWKWWTMDRRVRDTSLINRASTDRVYGPQDAPSTYTGQFTGWDAIAADYDLRRDPTSDAQIASRIRDHFGTHSPRTLDVGCGSGALLDLGVVSPDRYTGIDSSQGMLNELVLKHPTVARVLPARFEDLPDASLDGPFELVVAMDLPGVDTARLRALSEGLVVVWPDDRESADTRTSQPATTVRAASPSLRPPSVRS
jgi:hypothetical protein